MAITPHHILPVERIVDLIRKVKQEDLLEKLIQGVKQEVNDYEKQDMAGWEMKC